MTTIPIVGSFVRLTTRWPHCSGYSTQDQMFMGTIVNIPSYWSQHKDVDTLAIETGNPQHPISLINLERIVDVEYIKGSSKLATKVSNPVIITVTVAGSKGKVYNVESRDGKWTCTCTGFEFRNQCKHINQVKSEING